MTEKTETQTNEKQTKKQTAARKLDGLMTKKFEAKTFVAEIFFDHNSKVTFQDKMLRIIRSEKTE